MDQPKIDVKKLVAAFGTPTTLANTAQKYDIPLSVKTVNMWIYRKRISSQGMVQLSQLARKLGRRIDLNDYVISDTPTNLDFLG